MLLYYSNIIIFKVRRENMYIFYIQRTWSCICRYCVRLNSKCLMGVIKNVWLYCVFVCASVWYILWIFVKIFLDITEYWSWCLSNLHPCVSFLSLGRPAFLSETWSSIWCSTIACKIRIAPVKYKYIVI